MRFILPRASYLILTIFISVSTHAFAQKAEFKWYRGNTHVHTVLSGHGDTSPEDVSKWYLDRGYHFLVLSEHNKFIDPTKVELPEDRRQDFILIPGVELTGTKKIHATALNVKKVIPWQFEHEKKWKIVAEQLRQVELAGGAYILNHPNWQWALTGEDLLPVKKLSLFELYNGSPDTHNHGDLVHDGTEAMWDKLLTAGRKIFAVASDDAHQFKTKNPGDSNPGTGWVMVRSQKLDPDSITHAMKLGQFYASSGIVLKDIEHANGEFCVEMDRAETLKLLDEAYVTGHEHEEKSNHRGRHYEEGPSIEFVTINGEVAAIVSGDKACLSTTKARQYMRAKIVFTRKNKLTNKSEEFYAWTQPIFLP